MASRVWGIEDPLHRGDDAEGVRTPDPVADASIVRHVLYLDGMDRPTPYLSTTEDEETAERFAGRDGRVWHTEVGKVEGAELRYISKGELLDVLRGKGKGDAQWSSAFEVAQARAYVEQWAEHLIGFRCMAGKEKEAVAEIVSKIFARVRQ